MPHKCLKGGMYFISSNVKSDLPHVPTMVSTTVSTTSYIVCELVKCLFWPSKAPGVWLQQAYFNKRACVHLWVESCPCPGVAPPRATLPRVRNTRAESQESILDCPSGLAPARAGNPGSSSIPASSPSPMSCSPSAHVQTSSTAALLQMEAGHFVG